MKFFSMEAVGLIFIAITLLGVLEADSDIPEGRTCNFRRNRDQEESEKLAIAG